MRVNWGCNTSNGDTGMLEELPARWREEAAFCRVRQMTKEASLIEFYAGVLEDALVAAKEETITVSEAARMASVSEETVRRAVRQGTICDLREAGKGPMLIPMSAVGFLQGKSRGRAPARNSFDAADFARSIK